MENGANTSNLACPRQPALSLSNGAEICLYNRFCFRYPITMLALSFQGIQTKTGNLPVSVFLNRNDYHMPCFELMKSRS